VLRVFGLTDFLFRPFDFAGILDCPTLGSARGSRFQPFCQCRVGRPCAKLFQRDLSWRSMKSGCLKPAIYFDLVSRPRISIWHGLFSSTHAPAYDRRFNWAAGIHTVPSAVTPSAQKWNDIGADVILAKKLKRLVRRRNTFVSEGVDTLLPRRHAVLFIPAVTISACRCDAAMASRRAYITPTSA
jgi:hypothetical protein